MPTESIYIRKANYERITARAKAWGVSLDSIINTLIEKFLDAVDIAEKGQA